MGKNVGTAKGRVTEAVGDLTNDNDLKREGKRDRVGAAVKDKTANAADTISDAVDTAKDKLNSKD